MKIVESRIASLLQLLLPLLMESPASALYFPQSDLTLRLPYPAGSGERLSSDIKLINLRTLGDDSSVSKNAKYRISTPRERMASLVPETGDIVLHALPEGGPPSTILVRAREEEEADEAFLEIKIRPVAVEGKRINCADYIEDMCFWNTSRYRIYENQPRTVLGAIGPGAYGVLCPDFHISRYELLNGTKYFGISEGELFANASLDRDVIGPPGGPGPRLELLVRCVIWQESTGIQHAPTANLLVEVLDQDDNPPLAQGNRSVAISLRDFKAGDKLDHGTLIFKDADARNSNRYAVRILEDVYDALNVTFDTFPIEHPKYPDRAPSTAIVTSIYSKTTLLPKSPYRVILQVKDESLIPGYGEDTLNVTLTFSGPEHRAGTTTAASTSARESPSYPSSVRIGRAASRYSRVAKPSGEPPASMNFSLHGSRAFDVTRKGGIVYVLDEDLLELEPATVPLKLKWSTPDGGLSSRTIRVNLVDVPPSKLDACARREGPLRSCANAKTKEDCESSCGVASGALGKAGYVGRCAWRANRADPPQMSAHYSTCSPNLAYCPDNKCDELERLNPVICPQDCTVESDVLLGHVNKAGRGIKSGLGTCACDDELRCTCGFPSIREGKDKVGGGNGEGREGAGKLQERENEVLVSDARKAYNGHCGPVCTIAVIGAIFFVLIVIVGSFVAWRHRMASKGARRDCKRRTEEGVSAVHGILPSDYVDRGNGLLIGLDSFATTNRHLLLPKTCPPDPKWEFPRSRLTIEQVLGEGEFGRVLRAKALDIGGTLGPTTVAVKTLKEDACASELADLLSEYQLLKEAQHPNVIRLLGACTGAGGPVYLIIEFAEFGSLRNYLRRSRHLESEGRTPCTSSLLSTSPSIARVEFRCVEPVTDYAIAPRDILGFAWQISKGMAYLADIKLVHRDLAARNVLLAAGKVCKISDFGLTRDVYEDDAYLKRSKGRVPVKWMAPESLADHVYTSKSDVWSFGVLLWELVTLGASPYPGVDVHNLYGLLKAGYRMERPANCSQQLYKLMVSCWHQEPAMRPSFKELTGHWERMLEDGVEYLDLNPRTVHNQAYFASLHALDSPTSSGNGAREGSGGNLEADSSGLELGKTDTVNYLGKPSADRMTKCDNVDKLHALWQRPESSLAEEGLERSYVNECQPRPNLESRYETPIKRRNASTGSNTENAEPRTPTKERPQSYMDMRGGNKSAETEDLLVFANSEGKLVGDDEAV
ncbi:hypothetical protein KM043_001615 [Ampulex compressa]|nr:hypothetical protein KM043_001615 [Ampulex compressa]